MATRMDIARLVLEYFRVIASWPVAILVLGVVVLVKFKIPITALIDRIASIRLPGGSELMTPQPAPIATDQDSPTADAAALASERERGYLWEYRYLNQFLVPATQTVLDWLTNRPSPPSYATYDSWLLPVVPNPSERGAIINALSTHHLIQLDHNQLISVTQKGLEYLQFRGPLNYIVAAWNASRGLRPPSASVSPSFTPSPSASPSASFTPSPSASPSASPSPSAEDG